MKKYQLVIFDLDGTLLDTAEGIINSVRHAEKNMKLEPASEEEVKTFIGPPTKSQYIKIYQINSEEAEMATAFHRKYGIERGVYEAKKYEGVDEVLQCIRDKGIKIAVATLKNQKVADRILSIFSLNKYFDLVIGDNKLESLSKGEQMSKICEELGASKEETLMIGDSLYDAAGAEEAGVDFIGALYGYGFRDKREIEKYGGIGSILNFREILKYFS